MSQLLNVNGNSSNSTSAITKTTGINFEELATFEYAESGEGSELLNALQQNVYKPDYKMVAFRRMNATKNKTFQWNIPGTDFREVQQDIIAFRGVIIEPRFGFFLFNSETKKGECSTVYAEHNSGLRLDDPMPLPVPVYSPQEYGKENTPAKDLTVWNPMGSRGKSCFECVSCGENIRHYLNSKGEPEKDDCGLSSQVIFYVTQFGFQKINVIKRTTELNWVNVVDVRDQEGNQQFDKPVILNISISRMPVTRPIGPKLQVKTVGNGGVAPADSETLGKFLRNLLAEGRVVPLRGGKRVAYKAIVDLYAAQPTEAFPLSPMTQCVPVFSVCQDPEMNDYLESTLRGAHMQYAAELMDAVKNPTSNTSVATVSSEEVVTEIAPDAPSVSEPEVQTQQEDKLEGTSTLLSQSIFS